MITFKHYLKEQSLEGQIGIYFITPDGDIEEVNEYSDHLTHVLNNWEDLGLNSSQKSQFRKFADHNKDKAMKLLLADDFIRIRLMNVRNENHAYIEGFMKNIKKYKNKILSLPYFDDFKIDYVFIDDVYTGKSHQPMSQIEFEEDL